MWQTFLESCFSQLVSVYHLANNSTSLNFSFLICILRIIFFFSTFFIYFCDRERHSMNGGGAEREGDTESETGSRLRTISPEPDAGLELTDREIVTWLKSDA